jgi:hypothetical protein
VDAKNVKIVVQMAAEEPYLIITDMIETAMRGMRPWRNIPPPSSAYIPP